MGGNGLSNKLSATQHVISHITCSSLLFLSLLNLSRLLFKHFLFPFPFSLWIIRNWLCASLSLWVFIYDFHTVSWTCEDFFSPDLIYPTEQLIMMHLRPTSSKTVSVLAHPSIAFLPGILDNVLGHIPLFSVLPIAKRIRVTIYQGGGVPHHF